MTRYKLNGKTVHASEKGVSFFATTVAHDLITNKSSQLVGLTQFLMDGHERLADLSPSDREGLFWLLRDLSEQVDALAHVVQSEMIASRGRK